MAFITFEGIDGCGKSTQLRLLHSNLLMIKLDVVVTREPGGTFISEKIRNLLLDKDNKEMTHRCELLMYLAARAQHVEQFIKPKLLENKIVLSDRFEEATFAYQGAGRDISLTEIMPLNTFATGGLTPDLTIVLDITTEESEKRFKETGKDKDRLELNDNEFFVKVRKLYLDRAIENPGRVILIDGSLPIEEIEQKVFIEAMKVINRGN